MAPNDLRFQLLEKQIADYQADGVIDITLSACHAYNVERDKMIRLCKAGDIPYLTVESSFTSADIGQIKTRVTAFIKTL